MTAAQNGQGRISHANQAFRLASMTALTPDQAVEKILATEEIFATGNAEIRGESFRIFRNIPPHLRALLQASWDAQDQGRACYLVQDDERWSYAEFCRDIKCMAEALRQEYQVEPGDRVALAMHNCPELLILTSAISSLGAVVVFLNAWWTTEELDYALGDSGARLVCADGPRLERLRPLAAPRGLTLLGVRDAETYGDQGYRALRTSATGADWPDTEIDTDSDFAIMYSSGTTGHPKGVVLTHRGAMNAVFTWLLQAVIGPLVNPPAPDAPEPPRPAALIVTPLFHVTATHPNFLLSLPAGAKLALIGKWDAEEAVRIIRDEQITRILGVPTQSAELAEAAERMGEPLPSLSYLGSGGAKRPAAQVAGIRDQFPGAEIGTGWGMTETNAIGIGLAGAEYHDHPGVAGRLYPPLQDVRFLDDAGADVPAGEIGEITVRSVCNMRCYLNKPEATAEVLQGGWLRTGDLGRIDADGLISILDRKKNIIIRGGENIACLDVEGALHRHPAVAEACAFPMPDARLGEIVGAAIYLRPGHDVTEDALRAFLAPHIARFKIPEQIWLRRTPLPRGATDKIDRRTLRRDCLAARAMSDL